MRRELRWSRKIPDTAAKDAKKYYLSAIFFPTYHFDYEKRRAAMAGVEGTLWQMTEGELAVLAEDGSDLTEVAQEALQAVIAERGLDIQLKLEPPAQLPGHPPEDGALVILGWAENAEQAGRIMTVLAAAGISSFLNVEVREGDLKTCSCSVGGRIRG